ncbi:urea transporter [Enterobacteriaceae bacterium YMB-R22]|uniref:urea transporter n=1 Tax=Tenebrionicola larvae TaxID=2815733 RepID=UPI0020119E5F|nr:urea transporter [Tenebrionicola larvae]MBV4411723.1 urea transporter [Tenebrionicola larvae]
MDKILLWDALRARHRSVAFVDMVLRGCSQVMFQNNPLTGLLFFIAIAVGAYGEGLPQVVIGSLLGTVVATLSAAWLVNERETLRAGLYGYNGCLVGTALPTFLQATPFLWVVVIFSGIISVIVTVGLKKLLRTWDVSVLTAPFVLTTWIILLASYPFGQLHHIGLPAPAMPSNYELADSYPGMLPIITSALHGASQVFLSSNAPEGLLVMLGLAVSSLRAMLLALMAALLAVAAALLIGADPQPVSSGLYVFSAVLTALALGSVYKPSGWHVLGYIFIGVIFTVLVQGAFNTLLVPLGIPPLTMPFVVTCWLFLIANPNVIPTTQS